MSLGLPLAWATETHTRPSRLSPGGPAEVAAVNRPLCFVSAALDSDGAESWTASCAAHG